VRERWWAWEEKRHMQERGGGCRKRSGTCKREVVGMGRGAAHVRERWQVREEKWHM